VTAHLAGKVADPVRGTLRLLTSGGRPYFLDPAGNHWRVVYFVDNTYTIDVARSPAQIAAAARAFGEFQHQLVDLPAPRLHETIHNFHYTPGRFQALQDAIARDAVNRAAQCRVEIAFALARQPITTVVTDAIASGAIPERITHNDTKINNILFDRDTDQTVCVIDLDTVMPGSALYDFGDMVRSSAGDFQENEKDLSRVALVPERFAALVEGYTAAAGFLNDREFELLPFAGRLLTFECGIRFLTDYLMGDKYFRISHPTENLDRARTQLRFVAELERREAELVAVVKRRQR
jgi:Ser/Thr protein kinase RdoA (MazF antagonist)